MKSQAQDEIKKNNTKERYREGSCDAPEVKKMRMKNETWMRIRFLRNRIVSQRERGILWVCGILRGAHSRTNKRRTLGHTLSGSLSNFSGSSHSISTHREGEVIFFIILEPPPPQQKPEKPAATHSLVFPIPFSFHSPSFCPSTRAKDHRNLSQPPSQSPESLTWARVPCTFTCRRPSP